MSATKNITTCFLISCGTLFTAVSHGQDFSAPSRYASNWTASRASYGQRMVNPAYSAPREFANRSASYWVERDPRYMPALPPKQASPYVNPVSPVTSYRPPYAPTAACSYGGCATAGLYESGNAGTVYRGQGPVGYAANVPTRPSGYAGYGSYAPPRPAKPAYSPHRVPEGYYRGDGIFGKDTVFAANQPVRNFFRYLMP